MKGKKILSAGTFDHFHIGHQYFLWQAIQNQAKDLTIIIARDITVQKIKGNNNPQNTEKKRLNRLLLEFKNQNNVKVQLGHQDFNVIKTIEIHTPDILYLGYDQKINTQKIQKTFPKLQIVRGESYHPQYFKSSKFKT